MDNQKNPVDIKPDPEFNQKVEVAATELENGNGCAAKLLLDSSPSLEEHHRIFGTIVQKHNEMYPDSTLMYKSEPAAVVREDNGSIQNDWDPRRVDTSIRAHESHSVPGLLWGKNVYSGWPEILMEKWDLRDQSRQSSCLDLRQSKNPISDHGLSLTGFE